jgi:hypothetical protein
MLPVSPRNHKKPNGFSDYSSAIKPEKHVHLSIYPSIYLSIYLSACNLGQIRQPKIRLMFEIYITFDLSMLASLASVGYLQGFAPRSAVNGVAQASRSAAVMQFEPGAGPPGERDMKGDVITGAHQTPARDVPGQAPG